MRILADVLAHRAVQFVLCLAKGLEQGTEPVAGLVHGPCGGVQFPQAGGGGMIADPDALLQQGAQAGVYGVGGILFAGGREVRVHRHHRVGLLEFGSAGFEVGFDSIGQLQQAPEAGVAPVQSTQQEGAAEGDGQ